MIYDESNPLSNNYNECKVNFTTISKNLKKSRNYLIFSAVISGMLGAFYSAVFYMIFIKGHPQLFKILNYINFISLFINSIIGIIAVVKSNEHFSLYYYLTTIIIYRISIIYQILRIILIFTDYFDSKSKESYYVIYVKVFAVFSLILSLVLYYFVTIWAKFYFLILKTYSSLFNRIITLENILKINPSFLEQFTVPFEKLDALGKDSYIPIQQKQ